MEKGPTPHVQSATLASRGIVADSRACSDCKREFQYTSRTSNLNTQSCSLSSTLWKDHHLSTSSSRVRNSVAISPILFTTVRTFATLSNKTSPISVLYGSCSGRRFKWAT